MGFAKSVTIVLLLAALLSRADAASSTKVVPATTVLNQIKLDRGHIVLVNFWATWCPPCVAEYPNLVTLDRRYRSSGLDVIAVSLDFGNDAPTKVDHFVAEKKAAFQQFILNADDSEAAIDAFDKSWQGDLPRTFVYDRHGNLINTLPGPQNLAVFTAAVKRALASH